MRLARLIGPELQTLLEESPEEVDELLEEIHPEDLADIVAELESRKAGQILSQLPTDYAAQVFERLDEETQENLVEELGVESTARIATEMDADERADFFSILPPDVVAPLLEELETVDPQAAEDVELLTRWPETSAGGLMTTDYIAVGPELRISDVIEELRRHAEQAETLEVMYVVDSAKKLKGMLKLRTLLLAESTERVHDVMHHNVISVPPELDQEEVVRTMAKYDLHTMPVVSTKGVLLGVITSDDILDVMSEEQAEDVHKMGAVEPIEAGYFDASFMTYVRKRAPWLCILFVGGFLTTSAMEVFDTLLKTVTQLAIYIPLLVSAGGNSGSQSSTLIIRGLAVGDIETGDWWRVLVRELGQGLVLGAMLAVFGVLRVYIAGDGSHFALLVSLTIMGIVLMGCVVGGMMPIVLHRFGIDPATSSTPFISSLVDVLGIVIYLGLARWLLVGVLAHAASG
jgi:magnesium transporter